MRLFGLGNPRFKHRKFDYIPRHYDPEKEDLERRLSRYKIVDEEMTKERIKGSFRRKYGQKDEYVSAAQKRSNRIILITLVILIFLTYRLLTVYLPRIVESMQ